MAKQRRRRSYGIGRKFRRGKIWWVAVYDGSGNEIRRSTKSTEEHDADDLLGQLLRERSRGELVAINSKAALTIGDLLDQYLQRRSKLAPGTLKTYEYQAELLKQTFGMLPPAKLTTDMLSDYRDERATQFIEHFVGRDERKRLNRKVTQTSINRELGLLRSALRDMQKRRPNAVPALPYFPMESEKGNERQGFLTEPDFIEKLYPELPRHLKALSACALYGGGRKSEWLRVDWPEVDFDAMLIRFIKTKNKHPREVPIIPGLMLDSLLEALKWKNLAWPDEPAVFVYDGHRLATVGDAWDKACTRAGFPGLLFHDLRRSANKLMRDRGIPQNVRMYIMGHLTPSMDQRYGIVERADLDDARHKLASWYENHRLLLQRAK
jgi:integrase